MAQQRTPQVNESGMDHEALAAAAHGGAPGRPPAGAAGGPPSRDDAEVNESGIDQEAVAAADAALEEPDDADGVAEGMSGLRDDGEHAARRGQTSTRADDDADGVAEGMSGLRDDG